MKGDSLQAIKQVSPAKVAETLNVKVDQVYHESIRRRSQGVGDETWVVT